MLKAPFPYFGGKSRVAPLAWQAFGTVRNYVEPFAGSLAVLLQRPQPFDGTETVNDADGLLSNFWRALKADPEAVAGYADWPVNENDLHARHAWLVGQKQSLQASLEGDPDWYDAKAAGWWVWGMACWIGGGFCSGQGPWHVVDGQLIREPKSGNQGVKRQRVNLGGAGQGVKRPLVHLGNAGKGVNRQRVHLGDAGQGHAGAGECGLLAWMEALAQRLERVRVCCGDWARVTTPTPTNKQGLTAVFLDPPYADTAKRDKSLYRIDCDQVAHAVREWALANGDNPKLRIVLCGYDGEHQMPAAWREIPWKAAGGYANQGKGRGLANCHKERLWLSPHCLPLDAQLQEAA